MDKGEFAYRKNLENARAALARRQELDSATDQFKNSTAAETLAATKQGLMRPKARPEQPVSGGMAEGMGMALMESFAKRDKAKRADAERSTTGAMTKEEVTRPEARPENVTPAFGSFKSRMMQSESGGDSAVQIRLEDGRTMTGGYQFGDARLADYKKATNSSFTTSQFRNDPDLQNTVMDWHISSIDSVIDDLDTGGKSRDGLRAVAHLGGTGGMKKFVETNGKYNPSDKFGTRLSDYYNKFS